MPFVQTDKDQCVFKEVDTENMDELLRNFSTFEKLSGTEEAEAAVHYIEDKLTEYGVEWRTHVFQAYLSNPISSKLEVEGVSIPIESRPRSLSKQCPEGIEGELVYDANNIDSPVVAKKYAEFYKSIKNKIVLSCGFDEGYAKKIERCGAIALIQIWQGEEDALHEDTVGTVWGTPTIDTCSFLIDIPVICIKNSDGRKLIDLLSDNVLKARVYSELDTKVCKVKLPVAEIKGASNDFVLISGHYDTWYEGVVDNATGNAACLEAARILFNNRNSLTRSVRIAWWPGHSNGRYMGSTWYCDHFWDELYEHCIAHVNVDCLGAKGTEWIVVKSTMLEGKEFLDNIAMIVTGNQPQAHGNIMRGGDQASFWGTRIPIVATIRHEVKKIPGEFSCPGSGVTSWHTPKDIYDKVDLDILEMDTQMMVEAAYQLANRTVIPHDFKGYFSHMKAVLEAADRESDESFCFKDLYFYLDKLEMEVERSLQNESVSDTQRNQIIKQVGGEMNRLMHTYSDRYQQDDAIVRSLFPHICNLKGVYENNVSTEDYLFLSTEFVRQRNRFVTEIKMILQNINQIANNDAF